MWDRPDGPEALAYRQWMTSVLQPINEKAAVRTIESAYALGSDEFILGRPVMPWGRPVAEGPGMPPLCWLQAIVQGGFSLLEGSAIEPQLLQLVAHVSATRVILERWGHGLEPLEPANFGS